MDEFIKTSSGLIKTGENTAVNEANLSDLGRTQARQFAQSQDADHLRLTIDEPASTSIQLKICMQFQGEDELHDILLNSTDNQNG